MKGDKGRKESRKTKLVDLYKKCGEDSGELWESLEKTPDDEFKCKFSERIGKTVKSR